MSEYAVLAKISSDQPLTESEVQKTLITALSSEFDKVKIETRKGKNHIKGRIRTSMLNPVMSFVGTYEIETRENKARIKLDARSKANGWFWFTLILFAVLFFPFILLLILQVYNQKKRMREAFDRVRNTLQHDLSDW